MENEPSLPQLTAAEVLALSQADRAELLCDVGQVSPRIHRLIGRTGLLNIPVETILDSYDAELDDGDTIIRGCN